MNMCNRLRTSLLFVTLLWVIVCSSALSGGEKSIAVSNDGTSMVVRLSDAGVIEAVTVNGKVIEGLFRAGTLLDDCTVTVVASKQDKKGYRFVKSARHVKTGNECTITEYLYPAGTSIRWEIEIVGKGNPWSTPIVTGIEYPANEKTRYWTAWGRPQIAAEQVSALGLKLMQDTSNHWIDPLAAIPLANSLYYYGAPYETYENPELIFCPADFPHMRKKYNGALISIPMVALVETDAAYGISVVLSPEDYTQDMTLETSANGVIAFRRIYHRIASTNPIRFSLDLVPHRPDWRPGLDWMSRRYPKYFEPARPIEKEMYGTGAYSNHDVAFDAQKMKAMTFSVNWKASFDFPYMGMFLPPVDTKTTWTSFAKQPTSIAQMQAYAKKMKDLGFFVLNYFNVTEFGTAVVYPPPAKSTKEGEEWKDCNDFMFSRFPQAVLMVPEGMNLEGVDKISPRMKHGLPYFSWYDCVAMDPGNKEYQDFLIEQAQRHIDMIPASHGFCIDRMDWLRLFNERTDDGRSWFADKPAGSLVLSWQRFMERLGPLVHAARKVIFVNNHTKRLDLLKHTDGFFDEFTYEESPLNLTAFTAIRKPFSGWTSKIENVQKEGADNFFQKYLYMGAFPMCPFPGNDHSIGPDPWVDQQYLDYGPLMRMMQGREWVLEANPVSVDGDEARANVFKVSDGYVIPIVFGKKDSVTVRVTLPRPIVNPGILVQYPGEKSASVLGGLKRVGGKLLLPVTLKRGCAMVKIGTTKR